MSLFSKARKSLVEAGKAGVTSAKEAAGTAGLGCIGVSIAEPGREAAVRHAPAPRRQDGVVGATADPESEFGDLEVIELDGLEPANDLVVQPDASIDTGPVLPGGGSDGANVITAASGQTAGAIAATPITPAACGSAARSFAIADAIRLLKALPAGPKVEMVVQLVRVTLGEANVGIDELSEELEWKEKVVEEKLAQLRAETDLLEKQLQAKRSELAAQQSEAKELDKIRGRLNMALSPAAHRPPPIPAAAIKRAIPTGLAVQGV